jgi:hypothetical protein
MQLLESDTYVPVVVVGGALQEATPISGPHYSRIGDIVTVSCKLSVIWVDVHSAGNIQFPLPVATAAGDVGSGLAMTHSFDGKDYGYVDGYAAVDQEPFTLYMDVSNRDELNAVLSFTATYRTTAVVVPE